MLAGVRWHCQHYEAMAKVTELLEPKTYEGGFYRAVLAVHHAAFDEAQACIDAARHALHPQLAAHGVESYARAHGSLVRAQHLAEMEELIQYRRCQLLIGSADAPLQRGALLAGPEPSAEDVSLARERCACIKERWRQRLRSCGRDLRAWQTMVEVRAMALRPHEQMQAWLKFASLCRKAGRQESNPQRRPLPAPPTLARTLSPTPTPSLNPHQAGRLELCRLSLSKLLPPGSSAATLPVHQLASGAFDGLLTCAPALLYAYAKYLWVCGAQPAAIELLQRLLQHHVASP